MCTVLYSVYCTIQCVLYCTVCTVLYSMYCTIQCLLYYTVCTVLYSVYCTIQCVLYCSDIIHINTLHTQHICPWRSILTKSVTFLSALYGHCAKTINVIKIPKTAPILSHLRQSENASLSGLNAMHYACQIPGLFLTYLNKHVFCCNNTEVQ